MNFWTDLHPRRWGAWRLSVPLFTAATALALLTGFALLAGEVVEGDTHAFDMLLLAQAVQLRSAHAGLTEVLRDLTALGSTVVMTLMALALCGYLITVRRWLQAVLVGASIGSAALLVGVLKGLFGRARPDLAYAAFEQGGLSFPSGHASMSAVVYLTLGMLLASTRPGRAERLYLLGCAFGVTVMVGATRVMLGVHWATDVVGGWAFGSAWAAVWWLLLQRWAPRSASAAPP